MSGNPTLPEVLKLAVKDGTAKIHTVCPAIVTAYDPEKQTVSARVVVRSRYKDPDGVVQSVKGPILTNVPVLFPRSRLGFGITFPLVAGDWVTLHIAERSISEWKATGNTDIEAGDLRRFDLSDSFAYPGGQPPVDPIGASGVDPTDMVIEAVGLKLGSSSAADPISLSSLTDSAINQIVTLLKTWTPVPADGGLALKTAAIATLSTAATGSAKVKSE